MQSLSEAERRAIVELARQTVLEAVCHHRAFEPIPQAGVFERRCGAFVTLHVRGKLHGCIGMIEPRASLGETIVKCAISAALEDPRFSPMQPEEAAQAKIEVSLLSPVERIRVEEIEIGKQGLLVENGPKRGLLLPQVAVEHQLDRETFLRETCHKAGLAGDAWKDPETKIYGFTCEVIRENRQE
ncbi:MAG TPA: AmmeMemoRadiSam system protein A [Candidatus Acidoferrum sp.]|jgi:AmmeMemoRadiSam system protein A|nr:AmmeMemoRadiSam system protein A [Candidatus Acidoferrum sp.]